jgi:hypothetical protein
MFYYTLLSYKLVANSERIKLQSTDEVTNMFMQAYCLI